MELNWVTTGITADAILNTMGNLCGENNKWDFSFYCSPNELRAFMNTESINAGLTTFSYSSEDKTLEIYFLHCPVIMCLFLSNIMLIVDNDNNRDCPGSLVFQVV